MSTEIEKLSSEDRECLLRAPALVALLAAVSDDGEVSEHEKAESIKLAHFKTYTSRPILRNFYKEVDLVFEDYFNEELSKLPEDWKQKEEHLKQRILSLNPILPKLDEVYSEELVTSLKGFARHVFKSNSNFLQHFVLPIFTTKLTDNFDPKIGNR